MIANDPPTLVADTIERYPTQSVKVSELELLSDDSDPEGNGPLIITGLAYLFVVWLAFVMPPLLPSK